MMQMGGQANALAGMGIDEAALAELQAMRRL